MLSGLPIRCVHTLNVYASATRVQFVFIKFIKTNSTVVQLCVRTHDGVTLGIRELSSSRQ
jgi:hypothetical protein